MGREREEVEALRRRIVAEAVRRFADAGFRGTSIQQIADAVGIGKTLVLYHFPSKEALRTEALGAVAGAWEALLPRLAAGTDPPEQALGEIVELMRAHPELPRFVLRELLDSGSDVAGWLALRVGPATEAAAGAVQRGRVDAGDAHARVILAGVTLLAVLSLFPPGPDGRLTGPTADDGGLGERVLAEALRAMASALR